MRNLLLPLLVCVVMTTASIFWQHGGFLHPEIEARLPYYDSGGSLWSKLYDSNYLDGGMFQARELSYFFDYIDCRFIALCVALGHPHFLSLAFYVGLTLICLLLWRFGIEELKLERWIVAGALLLLWTTPAVFLGGTFFRTAKIGVALAVVVLYGRILRFLRAARGNPGCGLSARLWLGCFAWAWAATLFDRQGVFMVGLAVFFLAFWFLAYREKNTLELMGPFIAALALSVLYNHIIAPWLTLTINGYWPDFKYQQLPWSDLAEEPLFFLSQGALLYMDTVRFFLGNIPRWAAVIVVLGLGCAAVLTGPARQKNKPFVTAVLGFFLSQTVLIWVMLTLMLLRHGGLRWPDVRRVYYFLPILAMLCMTLLVALAHLSTPRKWLVAFLLGGAIVGNILALPRHDAILREGSLRANFQSTPALLDALRNLHNHQYPVSPEISRNRVFQFFHDGYFVKEPLLLPRDKDNAAPKKNPRA